jgi:hypothetical protein
VHDPLGDLDAISERAFDDALELLREQGLDPDEVLARVGANLTYWHDHPAEFTGEDLVDEE